MSFDQTYYIDVARRAMNLLTKRGLWQPPPISPQNPRVVSFSSGEFKLSGAQLGRETAFECSYGDKIFLRGLARINWLTEDESFTIKEAKLNGVKIDEFFAIYSDQIPDSII